MPDRHPPSSRGPSRHADQALGERVREALGCVRRSDFAPFAEHLPAKGLVESMLRALHLTGSERVLEFGSISGYETALLSQLAREVVSLERTAERAEKRTRVLSELGYRNVTVIVGHDARDALASAPYQAILIASGAPELPAQLLNVLDSNGRLVIPLGDKTGQIVELVNKHGFEVHSEALCPCRLPMLEGASGSASYFPWNG